MTPSAATQPCAVRRRPLAAGALALALAACAGAPSEYTPGRLDEEQLRRCRAVAEAYVAESPEYPGLRDGLRDDPVALRWFVRYLETELVQAREGRAELTGNETLRADPNERDDLEQKQSTAVWEQHLANRDAELRLLQRPGGRAAGEITAIGEPAVEVVVQDLLLSGQEFLRAIGIEVLGGIGDVAVPRLLAIARGGEPAEQRAAARAIGAIGADGAALEALAELARSSEWRVRSGVAQALGSGGAGARELLLTMLRDEDAFVRRQAAAALGRHRGDVASGRALVDYLVACKEAEDFDGERAAQKALQEFSQTRGPRSVSAWRDYLAGLGDR